MAPKTAAKPAAPDSHRTTPAQRAAQRAYGERKVQTGYVQTRVWIPEEFREWHEIFVRRAREWKKYGTEFTLPALPDLPKEKTGL